MLAKIQKIQVFYLTLNVIQLEMLNAAMYFFIYIYFVCVNNADDDERRKKNIRTSFQVRLMLLLLVDAKENVIKNLFMAANEISPNPSAACFFHIRFDKRAQSARSTVLQIVQLPY